ncbi:hypothetical protein HMSSN036_72600 [Paenibacillus macerans]|nr:hypothetical protein HMSSN036_72600 [Paenibacillus macerans]
MRLALICAVMVGMLLGPAAPQTVNADSPHHFGFKKSVNGSLPSINEEGFKEIVDKHGAIFLGDTSRKELFLTFDNGYENGYTAPILDTLKAKKVPAVFSSPDIM